MMEVLLISKDILLVFLESTLCRQVNLKKLV